MNKRIIIHIGFPRCGSTLLQREIFPRLEGDVRVVSPACKDRRLIDFLNGRFVMSGRNIDMAPVTDAEKKHVADVIAEYPESTVLVSNEGLVGDSFDNMLPLPHLAGALRALFEEPEILVVIRRQSDIVRSYYRYALEEGFYKSFPAFLGYRDGRFAGFRLQRYAGINVDPTALNFHSFVSCLQITFGAGKIHVLPFEWIKSDFGRFRDMLAQVLGARLQMADSLPPPVNSGVHGADFFLLRGLNRLWATRLLGFPLLPRQPLFDYFDNRCRDGSVTMRVLRAISARVSPTGVLNVLSPVIAPLLNPLLSALGAKGLRSEQPIAQAIDRAVFESNAALNEKLGGRLSGLGYCDRQ